MRSTRGIGIAVALSLTISGCGDSVGTDELQPDSQNSKLACVFGPGFWRSHSPWPASSLTLGVGSYSEAQLRAILNQPVNGNGLVSLAHQLIAAKLNIALGASSPELSATIAAADALIGTRVVPPIGTGFLSLSTTSSLESQLEELNSGNPCSIQCVGPQADLAITKTVSNTQPNVGDTITFTVTLSDNGPSNATNVTVTDLLPAGLSLVSVTPSQGSYSSTSGVWTVGSVTTSTPQTLVMQAMLVTPSSVTNDAAISHADQSDPNTGNNAASATASAQRADLAIAKTVSNTQPNVGDTITFTVTVSNLGPDAASNVDVTDLLPAGLTFVSASLSQGSYSSTTGVWAVGTVTTSTPQTLTMQALVVTPNRVTNTAAISHADQFDPSTVNNSASVSTTAQRADLAISKTVSNARPNVGDTITFTVTASNLGPAPATQVAVTDLLPAGLTFVSSSPSQGSYSNSTGVWTVGTVTTSTPQTLVMQALVVSPNSQTNTADVSHADQFDPSTINNSASATEIPQQADLAIGKTVSNAQPSFGDTITFTVTASNNGPDAATNVTVADLLPAGLSFVSSTPSQGTYSNTTGVWTVGTVTTSTPQTLAIQVQVMTASGVTNTASVSHTDQFDPNTGNNSASSALFPSGTPADLVLGKRVDNPRPNVGDTIAFTVTLTNDGPSSATGVAVTDLLPAGLNAVSAAPSQGSYVFATGVWTVGTLANAASATLTVRATVVSSSAQTNTATISAADQFDPDTSNNSSSATVTPQQADLTLTGMVSNSQPHVGDTITFTITLSDLGPSSATGVTVNDLLPAGLTAVAASPSQGSYSFATGLWDVGTVTPSVVQTLVLQAKVVSASPQTNMATIGHADQFDPNTPNNSASVTETPQ
jgi:uncharacterized repeat protein (TIGR01451 family)